MLFHPEYEVLFLPCVGQMAGRPIEQRPTQDQLPLTRMLDLDVVRKARVPCFATLERALGFIAGAITTGAVGVYPPPADGAGPSA